MKIFLIGTNPVRRDIVLGGWQIHFALANELMQTLLQPVFHMRIPARRVRLRPEVTDRWRSTQIGCNEVVHLEVVGAFADAVFGEHLLPDFFRNVSGNNFSLRVAANLIDRDRLRLARGKTGFRLRPPGVDLYFEYPQADGENENENTGGGSDPPDGARPQRCCLCRPARLSQTRPEQSLRTGMRRNPGIEILVTRAHKFPDRVLQRVHALTA